MKTFWMLYAEILLAQEGPVHKHETEALARAEAERLARELKTPVYLLEAIAKCEVVAVKWEEQETETE